jgi:hypothetical protein
MRCQSNDSPEAAGPRRQISYVVVEWLDAPHGPESHKRLAQVLANALEHAHNVPADAAPARFVVRVRTETTTSEVSGTVVHHHHHPA